MRLTILGGGGFRVPLVYQALLRDTGEPRVTEVVLHDVDPGRLAAIGHVLDQLAAGHADAPVVRTATGLAEALSGATFVFCAMRVGGLHGRTVDERVALDLGLLGQETTGAGGVAFGLRTVPVAVRVAEQVARVCPDAWVVNFTNPAGMVTEAMRRVLGERVIGICDSPVGLGRRAARALGLDPAAVAFDYVGLNHLGWLRGLHHRGRDVLPDLLADDAALASFEEGQMFGADWIRAIGALPNEYLYYYYFTREAVASSRAGETRGEFLDRQQSGFYRAVAEAPDDALARWRRVRHERDASYLADTRTTERDPSDMEGGGYETVALALLTAISRGAPATMILNVGNGATLRGLPADAVIEVPCAVNAAGARPLATAPLAGHQLGLVAGIKAVERATIDAALRGSSDAAVAALALHPLVDSVASARRLLDGYRAGVPELAAVFA